MAPVSKYPSKQSQLFDIVFLFEFGTKEHRVHTLG